MMKKSSLKTFPLDSLIWILINLTLIVTPLFLLPYLIPSTTFPKFFIFSSLTQILFFFFLLKLFLEKTSFSFSPFSYFLFALALVAILSTLFSPHPFTSFWGNYHRSDGLICFLGYLFFAFLTFALSLTPEQKLTLMKTLSASGFLVSFFGLAQHWGYIIPHFSRDSYRVSSTLGNPDFLGSFLVLTLPLTLSLALYFGGSESPPNRKNFYIFSLASATQLTALYLTYTRAAWIGAFLSFPFITFYLFKAIQEKRIEKAVVAQVLLIIVFFQIVYFLAAPYLARQLPEFPYGFEDETYDFLTNFKSPFLFRFVSIPQAAVERFALYRQALKVIENRSFSGTGLDTYHFFSARYNRLFKPLEKMTMMLSDRPHNDFLQVAANLGSTGLLVYLSLIIFTFFTGLKALKNSRWPNQLLLASLLTGFGGYFIQNQFSFSIIPTALFFMVCLALINSFSKTTRLLKFKPLSLSLQNSLVFYLILFLLLGTFLFLLIKISFNPLIARAIALKAVEQASAGNFEAAIEKGEKAANLMSSQPEYFILLGEVYFQASRESNNKALLEPAFYYFRRAIEANPYHPLSQLKLGVSLLKAAEMTGKPEYVEESNEVFKKMLPLTTNPGQVYYNLGVGYYYLKNYRQARKSFKLCLEVWPEEKDAWFLLGKIAEKEKDFKEALRCYRMSLRYWEKEKKNNKEKGGESFWQLEEKVREAISRLKK